MESVDLEEFALWFNVPNITVQKLHSNVSRVDFPVKSFDEAAVSLELTKIKIIP